MGHIENILFSLKFCLQIIDEHRFKTLYSKQKELTGLYGGSTFRFLRDLHIACHNSSSNLLPTSSLEVFLFPEIPTNICCCYLIDDSH
jgi:hypothetical protein